MNTLEEQYNEQFKAIKKHYRKRKIIGALIMGVTAIGCLTYFYLSYKKLIEFDGAMQGISLIFGIGCAVIAIRLPFHQTHNEYIQLRDLNSAYTHERFRERNG